MECPVLELKNVGKVYPLANGKTVEALRDINLCAKEGEFISLIGPSGCGKTTVIKLLAGFIGPTTGRIFEAGKTFGAASRNRGVIFQHYNLFPWLTVQKNIGFGLSMLDTPHDKQQKIVNHYVEVMGLNGFENTYPGELSGGMQQRVALARTLSTNPKILLMDEPFNALDMQTKRFMQDLLLQVWQKEPRTIVFVTHDVEEAVFMSDTVYIMSSRPGTIRERIEINLVRPRDLKTEFSEEFIKIKKHVQEIITKESLGLVKLNLEIYKDL